MVADSRKRALYSVLFIERTVSIATTTSSFDINDANGHLHAHVCNVFNLYVVFLDI